MSYQAVLFDLDGTLLDTLEDLANAGNRVLAARSLPVHPVAAYRYFVGDGIATLVERILPPELRNVEEIALAVAEFQREYAANWDEHSAPYTGIAAMLDALAAGGLRLAVLSNKPEEFTRLCVRRLLSPWPFDPVFGQRAGVAKKPDPAGALAVAQVLQLAPREILYVGDTSIDMHTARSAGMDAVGVLWGFRGAPELQAAGATRLISDPAELVPIALSPTPLTKEDCRARL